MTLYYEYGPEGFEYEIDQADIDKYLNQLPEKEFIDLAIEGFEFMKKEEAEEVLKEIEEAEYNTDQDIESLFKDIYENDESFLSEVFIYDILKYHKDELTDYFEDEASDAFEEQNFNRFNRYDR